MGSVDEDIQGATYEVTAKALGITVFSHKGDACKPETIKLPAGAGEIDMKGFACPLSKGNVELDLDIKLASTIPAKLARTTIDLKATSAKEIRHCVYRLRPRQLMRPLLCDFV